MRGSLWLTAIVIGYWIAAVATVRWLYRRAGHPDYRFIFGTGVKKFGLTAFICMLAGFAYAYVRAPSVGSVSWYLANVIPSSFVTSTWAGVAFGYFAEQIVKSR